MKMSAVATPPMLCASGRGAVGVVPGAVVASGLSGRRPAAAPLLFLGARGILHLPDTGLVPLFRLVRLCKLYRIVIAVIFRIKAVPRPAVRRL